MWQNDEREKECYIAILTFSYSYFLYRAQFIALGIAMITALLANLTGIALVGYYASTGCDPVKYGYIDKNNEVSAFSTIQVSRIPNCKYLYIVLYNIINSSLFSKCKYVSIFIAEQV